jgi:hypothetical protein
MRGNDQTPTPERLNMPTPLIETMPERTMNNEAKSELKAILAAYRARLVDSQEREAKLRIARASFVEGFRTLKAERIGPVLDEFVVQLNEEGHEANVVDQQEATDRNGHFTPSSLALRIVPARAGDVSHTSGARMEVTFSANQHTMKVLVSSSNNANGTMGKRGEYDLAELTVAFVVSNVLKTIREGLAIGK